ncbi:PREDICTED: uncharacterized protein LOC108974460 [Bactrocera latifrons]|uniref:uncharacterized protein LOC108974460 n=1 Tax=Bactrocera latifrons TaxID=174628 RepID=UPI0008DE92AC|nr:PREDICTED: uncharacterized protein LOC108974460 [Bactrocera latifrons]
MSTFSFLYNELSEELINSDRNVDLLTEYIKSRNSGVTDEDVAYVKISISQRFLPIFNKRWFGASQNIARFFASNSVWLTMTNLNYIYTSDTAKLFVQNYSWFYMPVTVHKVLMHGKDIMDAAVLPIGMLSEEAEEARNKDYRKYRLMFSRKCDRISTDVFNILLITSDPYISSLRRHSNKISLELDPIVKDMVLA